MFVLPPALPHLAEAESQGLRARHVSDRAGQSHCRQVGLPAHLFAAIAEDVGLTGQRLFLPDADLGRTDAEHLRDLGCRFVRPDGFYFHFGLGAGRTTLAGSGH